MKNFKLTCILLSTFVISGCSVYKAASNEGVAVSDIKNCTREQCLLSHGMSVIDQKEDDEEQYVVTYRATARKSGGSYLRAGGHAVLDVATLGLWEVVGTPVEGAMSNNRGYIVATATYNDRQSKEMIALQIYDANGNLASDRKTKTTKTFVDN